MNIEQGTIENKALFFTVKDFLKPKYVETRNSEPEYELGNGSPRRAAEENRMPCIEIRDRYMAPEYWFIIWVGPKYGLGVRGQALRMEYLCVNCSQYILTGERHI